MFFLARHDAGLPCRRPMISRTASIAYNVRQTGAEKLPLGVEPRFPDTTANRTSVLPIVKRQQLFCIPLAVVRCKFCHLNVKCVPRPRDERTARKN